MGAVCLLSAHFGLLMGALCLLSTHFGRAPFSGGGCGGVVVGCGGGCGGCVGRVLRRVEKDPRTTPPLKP